MTSSLNLFFILLLCRRWLIPAEIFHIVIKQVQSAFIISNKIDFI